MERTAEIRVVSVGRFKDFTPDEALEIGAEAAKQIVVAVAERQGAVSTAFFRLCCNNPTCTVLHVMAGRDDAGIDTADDTSPPAVRWARALTRIGEQSTTMDARVAALHKNVEAYQEGGGL